VRQARCRSLLASVSVVGCRTPRKAVRSVSVVYGYYAGASIEHSDSLSTTSRAPPEHGRQLPPGLRVPPPPKREVWRPRTEDGGFGTQSCVFGRFRSRLEPTRCWRQRRQWSSASRAIRRAFAPSKSPMTRASGGHRKVIDGRQLLAGEREGEGGLAAARSCCGPGCGVGRRGTRSAGGEEVATPSSSTAE